MSKENSQLIKQQVNLLMIKLNEIPNKYMQIMKTTQTSFLAEYSQTSKVVMNLLNKFYAMTELENNNKAQLNVSELKEKTNERERSVSRTFDTSDDSESYSHDKDGHERKEHESIVQTLHKLKKENAELKSAQESMWMALKCSNMKYSQIIHEKDDLLEQLREDKVMIKSLSTDQLMYKKQLKDQFNSEKQQFSNLLTYNEINTLKEWCGNKSFSLLSYVKQGDKDVVTSNDNKTTRLIKQSKGIICLMKNQHESIYGYFSKNVNEQIKQLNHWEIPKDCEFCFSLRNLFYKEPVILLKKDESGKIQQS